MSIDDFARWVLVPLASLMVMATLPACGSDTTSPESESSSDRADAATLDASSAADGSPSSSSSSTDAGTSPSGPETGRSPSAGPEVGPTNDVEPPAPDMRDRTGGDAGTGRDAGDTTSDGGVQLDLASITPGRGPVDGGTKFVLEGQGLTPETVVYFGSRKAEAKLVNDQIVGQTPKAPSPGTVSVKALDPTNGDDVLKDAFIYKTSLTFDSASPTRLPAEGGISMTIRGSGFDQSTRVSIDGASALQHTLVDDGTLRVIAPANDPGSADLRVTNRSESLRIEEAVTYVETLELKRIRPATGPLSGGTKVTLRGRGFNSKMTVEFGNATANVLSVDANDTRAEVRAPAGRQVGAVDVSVETPDGDAALLEDAYYYHDASGSTFDLTAVEPEVGPRSGGATAVIRGTGLGGVGLDISFGGETVKTYLERGEGYAKVRIPAHAPGTVDVTATNLNGKTETLKDAFRYVADLSVDDVTPDTGKTRGNATVTITGKGFNGVETNGKVLFGGVPAQFQVQSDTKIQATAPRHAPGTVDVTVERGNLSATHRNGFTYTQDLEVYGFSPVRGSIAGDTYVVIRGSGFQKDDMDVTFGGANAKSVDVLDPHTLAARTPPHSPQAVDVEVANESTSVTANQQYTYFNPGARNGGTWGGPIKGAVNVTVYSKGGQPIPRAFVMLSTNPETTYKGKTNRDGLVTLSGPDVYGEQTITAIAPKYSSTTVQHVNSENVTIFLNPPTSSGSPPPGPPTATFKGDITGLNKIAQPGPSEFQVAYVQTTRKDPWSSNPDPDPDDTGQNVVRSNGQYKLASRVGDLALVAIGGLQNTKTGEFEPLRMGVKRYQFAAQGRTYERDLDLTIALDREMTFKLKNPPRPPKRLQRKPDPPKADKGVPIGPEVNRVVPYMDFGFEGVFGGYDVARGTSTVLTVDDQPQLVGPLSDISYTILGGTYTKREDGDDPDDQPDLGSPQSLAIKRDVTSTGAPIQLPPLLSVARVTSPDPGQKPIDGFVSFTTDGSNQPDFYFIQLLTPRGRGVWEVFLPGDANSFTLPDFPDFSNLPKKRQPNPYPPGTYTLSIRGIRHSGASLNHFTYSDLSVDKWEAVSIGTQLVRIGR